ncbi:MAG: O-antigen ligase family protein [Microlunatus sp.]
MNIVLLLAMLVIGVAGAVLAVLRPTIALVLLVAFDVSGLNGVIAAQTGFGPYKAELALALVALFVLFRRRQFAFAWSPVLLGLAVIFAGFCLSLLHAVDPVTSQNLLEERSRDLIYFLVAWALLCSTRRLHETVVATLVVLAALAGLTVVHEYVLHNAGDLYGLSQVPLVQEGVSTPRHAGTSSDVNFWARLLIMFTPLAFSLFALAKGWLPRAWWAGCVVSLGMGIYLTQSRGGFIALLIAVVVWLALAGGWYRRSLLALPFVLAALVALTGVGSRLDSLTDVTSTSTNLADPSVVTRKRLQLDALKMFLDAPVTGHGIGSYGSVFGQYDRLSNFYQPVDIVVASHNFYLEQAADGGVLLLTAWLLLAGCVIFCCLRALVLAGRAQNPRLRLLAAGVLSGVVGWAVASVFLHISDFRALLLLAAFAGAVDLHARRLPAPPATAAMAGKSSPRGSLVTRRKTVDLVLLSLAVVSALGAAAALSTGAPRFVSATTLSINPVSGTADGSTAYQQDIVSRGLLAPTFAAVLDAAVPAEGVAASLGVSGDEPVTVGFGPSRLGGAVVLTVTAGDAATAEEIAATAAQVSRQRLAALQDDYQLIGSPGPANEKQPIRRWAAPPLLMVALTCGALLLRRRRTVGGDPPAGMDRGARASVHSEAAIA